MQAVIYIFVFTSISLVSNYFIKKILVGPQEFKKPTFLIKTILINPFFNFLKKFNTRIFKMGLLSKYRENIKYKIQYVGLLGEIDADTFIIYQETLGLIFVVVGLVILPHLHIGSVILVPIYLLFFAFFGFYLVYMYLVNLIMKRKRIILKKWPFVLDLISISVSAGMDFVNSVERIVSKAEEVDPLIEELRTFLNEIKLGKRRTQALLEMGRRLDIPVINSVLVDIVQAEEMGTPLAYVLKLESREYRQRRAQFAEKKAMEAPVKMLFPLLFFIFPSVFLVLLGPILIQYISRGLK